MISSPVYHRNKLKFLQLSKVGNNQLEIIDIGQKTATGYTCILKTDSSIEKGFYNGKIVIQSVKPFAFVFN